MLEVFDPVPWSEFCDRSLDRLTPENLAQGFVIRFRWVFRQLCVSAVCAPAEPGPGASEGRSLDLHIAGGDGGSLWGRIREFAEEEVKRQHSRHPFFARVLEHGRVHLARPFRTTAICHKRLGPHTSSTALALTCHLCIRRGYTQINRKDPDYAQVTLSQAELKRARLPLEPDPAWDLIDGAIAELVERERGGLA
jgi:hypothetical protein